MRVARSRVQIEGLAARMVAADEQAYVEFADTFGPRLRAYFVRRGLNLSDADDLAVSCVTDIALKVPKYRSMKPGGFEAWIFTLAYHSLVNWFRARRVMHPLPEDLTAPEPSDDPEVNFGVVFAVREAVEQLDEADRLMIELRYLGAEHSYSEIADRLQITAGTARVRHFRALKRLENLLEKDSRISEFLKRKNEVHYERIEN